MAGMKRKAFRRLSFAMKPMKRTKTVMFRRKTYGAKPETKIFTVNMTSTDVNDTVQGIRCSDIGEGSDVQNRNARRVIPLALKLRLTLHVASGDAYNNLRLAVIRVRGKFLSSSPAAYIPTLYGGALTDVCEVLWDKTFSLTKNVTNDCTVPVQIDKRIKLNGTKMFWNGAGGTDDTNGCLALIAVSDSATGSGTHPNINGHIRLYFHDN